MMDRDLTPTEYMREFIERVCSEAGADVEQSDDDCSITISVDGRYLTLNFEEPKPKN